MTLNSINNTFNKNTSDFKFKDYNIFNATNKSFCQINNNSNAVEGNIYIKLEYIEHLKCLNIINNVINEYSNYFVKAMNLISNKDNYFLSYNINNLHFINFEIKEFLNIDYSKSLLLFKNFLELLTKLVYLNEDFKMFDEKLFFFDLSHKDNDILISFKYLYHCK